MTGTLTFTFSLLSLAVRQTGVQFLPTVRVLDHRAVEGLVHRRGLDFLRRLPLSGEEEVVVLDDVVVSMTTQGGGVRARRPVGVLFCQVVVDVVVDVVSDVVVRCYALCEASWGKTKRRPLNVGTFRKCACMKRCSWNKQSIVKCSAFI